MEPTRKLNWVSSIDPGQDVELARLQARMVKYYSTSGSYYSDIDFTAGAWTSDACYLDIVARLGGEYCRSIVEVGCGGANLLRYHPRFASRYAGCDFSDALITRRCPFFGLCNRAYGLSGGLFDRMLEDPSAGWAIYPSLPELLRCLKGDFAKGGFRLWDRPGEDPRGCRD
jgi:SAM-dependent methyltransferase